MILKHSRLNDNQGRLLKIFIYNFNGVLKSKKYIYFGTKDMIWSSLGLMKMLSNFKTTK